MQPEQRTRIPWIALQIFAKDFLSPRRVPIHQQSGTERFTDGIEPVWRFAILECVLYPDGLPKHRNRSVLVLLRHRDLAPQDVLRDFHDVLSFVVHRHGKDYVW